MNTTFSFGDYKGAEIASFNNLAYLNEVIDTIDLNKLSREECSAIHVRRDQLQLVADYKKFGYIDRR